MTQIGQFTRNSSGFSGHIRTLMLSAELVIVAIPQSDTEGAPDYRVHLDTEDGPEAEPDGNAPANARANSSPWLSMTRRCRSRSAPISSATMTPVTHGRCIGTARKSAKVGTDAMRMLPLLLSGLVLLSPLPSVAFAEPPTRITPSPGGSYADHIAEAATRFELPARWIRAVMTAESAGDPHAISPKGAMGLMQIMPATWDELRARHRLGADPYDPHDNIIAGTAYLRELFDRYGSPGWIAAYNAGPGRYEASLKGRTLPSETRAYIALVAQSLDANGPSDSMLAAPSNAVTWTQAPLFIAQNAPHQTAIPVPEKRPSSQAQATTDVRDVSAIEPQSDGLFVARASSGSTP